MQLQLQAAIQSSQYELMVFVNWWLTHHCYNFQNVDIFVNKTNKQNKPKVLNNNLLLFYFRVALFVIFY